MTTTTTTTTVTQMMTITTVTTTVTQQTAVNKPLLLLAPLAIEQPIMIDAPVIQAKKFLDTPPVITPIPKQSPSPWVLVVIQALMSGNGDALVPVQGSDYVRMAFQNSQREGPKNLCFIRPTTTDNIVKVDFKVIPARKTLHLMAFERSITIIFDTTANHHDSLVIVNGTSRKTYKQTNNQQRDMAGLVSLALYREKLIRVM